MSVARILFVMLGVQGMMVSCANPIGPYVDTRREAGRLETVGKSTPEKVSICYNSASTTPCELIAMAKAECAKYGKNIQFAGQTHLDCSLLVPTRVEFWCK